MAKKVNHILETYDYDKFKMIKGNRNIKKNSNLENSVKKNGIILPVDVNENMEVLDGQHRLEIARKYSLPVPYRIITGLGINDVIELNNTIKTWKLEDYIQKFVIEENQEYIRLMKLIDTHKGLPLSSVVSAAMGNLALSSIATQAIKTGNFKFIDYHQFSEFLQKYDNFINSVGLTSSQPVFFAFFNLYTTTIFDFMRLINGMKRKNIEEISETRNLDLVLEFLIRAHNYALREDSLLAIQFELTKKGKPIVRSPRDYTLVKL